MNRLNTCALFVYIDIIHISYYIIIFVLYRDCEGQVQLISTFSGN